MSKWVFPFQPVSLRLLRSLRLISAVFRMKRSDLDASNRREFFHLAARSFSGAALAGLAALATKSYLPRAVRAACLKKTICGTCSAFVECDLPRALKAKRLMKGGLNFDA